MFKSNKTTVASLTEEKVNVLSEFQKFIQKVKRITKKALEEKTIKLKEAEQAQKDAEALQKIADDNNIITSNFDQLLNNKNK